jgi:hypothetical protein
MFAFLFALFMGFATPNNTTSTDSSSGTVTTLGDSSTPTPTPIPTPPSDHGGETGNNPPR